MTRIALSLLVVLTLAACTSSGSGTSPVAATQAGANAAVPSNASPATSGRCPADRLSRRLPTWARAGFYPPTQRMPYVLGDAGDIAAIVWGPLVVPPDPHRNNKILWVSRVGSGDGRPLRIRADLAGTGQTVSRTVEGGPGPSIINLPAPGCWSFDLTWGSRHDHLQLKYTAE